MGPLRGALWAYFMSSVACACALPSFDKVGSEEAPLAGEACGLSDHLPRSCDACIRENCCAEAAACGPGTACGLDMLEPITPVAEFSPEFDPVLACLQNRCERACSVHWGCVDGYTWPEAESPIAREVSIVSFGSSTPIEGVTVQACSAVDPTPDCATGEVSRGVSNADGVAELSLPAEFTGLYRFLKDDYLPATARFSEPIHRVTGFTQFELTPALLSAFALRTGVHEGDQAFDPQLGHLIFRVQSCLPLRYLNTSLRGTAPNVRVSFDSAPGASQVFYTEINNEVSVARDRTSPSGFGGVFNLPPFNIAVTAEELDSGRQVATGYAQVPAGGMAFVYLVPRSRP